jgi:predicted transcriptional regulator
MEKNELLELETRRRIYNSILKCPGVHISDLSRKLDMPRSTLVYHLKYLEKHGFLEEKKYNNYMRYYAVNKIDRCYKEILNLFGQEATRKVIIYLAQNKFSSVDEISKHIHKHPKTVFYHLKKLRNAGIVECHKINREKRYVLCGGNCQLLFVVSTCENSFDVETNRVIKKFKKHFDKRAVDDLIEIICEIFPHPYHV